MPTLEALHAGRHEVVAVVSQPDRPRGRGRAEQPSPVSASGAAAGLPLLEAARRGFAEACSRVIEREANAGRPVTVMIFDIDNFKGINDRFGHPAGDEILKLFSVVIGASLRLSDLSGRIGGR